MINPEHLEECIKCGKVFVKHTIKYSNYHSKGEYFDSQRKECYQCEPLVMSSFDSNNGTFEEIKKWLKYIYPKVWVKFNYFVHLLLFMIYEIKYIETLVTRVEAKTQEDAEKKFKEDHEDVDIIEIKERKWRIENQ